MSSNTTGPLKEDQDSKQLIADSYNTIAPRYFTWSSPRPTVDRAGYIAALAGLIPKGSRVVELGCGAGVPATQQLVDLGLEVTGVDVSEGLIEIARREVRGAKYEVNDMLGYVNGELSIARGDPTYTPPSAILAFYTIWHLPPHEQMLLIQRAVELLAPGGWLILNMMTTEGEMKIDEWMGAPMISWGLGTEGNRRVFRELTERGKLLPSPSPSMGDDTARAKEQGGGMDVGTGTEGEVRVERVGKMEQEMHWFCVQKSGKVQ